MLDAGDEEQHVPGRGNALLAGDVEADAPALDDRHLLVRMTVHRRHDAGRERQAADHHALARDELPLDAVGDPLDRRLGPVPLAEAGEVERRHFRSDRPLSSPDPSATKSGWTLTTPYWRSSFSRLAAIIQTKLIEPPGAATLG